MCRPGHATSWPHCTPSTTGTSITVMSTTATTAMAVSTTEVTATVAGTTATSAATMPEPAAAADGQLQQALREFAGAPAVLIALDFDGCLAPFVLDPDDARPLPQSSTALADLARVP